MGWFWDRTLAGFLEEAGFDLGIEGCSGIRVWDSAEGRRRNFGEALKVRNAARYVRCGISQWLQRGTLGRAEGGRAVRG